MHFIVAQVISTHHPSQSSRVGLRPSSDRNRTENSPNVSLTVLRRTKWRNANMVRTSKYGFFYSFSFKKQNFQIMEVFMLLLLHLKHKNLKLFITINQFSRHFCFSRHHRGHKDCSWQFVQQKLEAFDFSSQQKRKQLFCLQIACRKGKI